MKNAVSYVGALDSQKAILNLFEDFILWFSENETDGYLFAENRTNNSIDITMGSERFTIISSIQDRGKIVFDVFSWEFDLSSITRYTCKRVEELTLVKDGGSLIFKHVQYGYNHKDFQHLISMTHPFEPKIIGPFFDQIEIYINKKNTPEPPKAY